MKKNFTTTSVAIMIYIKKLFGFILICSLTYTIGYSQELEPRAINNLPVGTN